MLSLNYLFMQSTALMGSNKKRSLLSIIMEKMVSMHFLKE